MTKQYKAVVFDLDGTLVDSMWIWKDIDIAYLKNHGHTLPDSLQKDIEGMSTTETASYFKARFNITDSIETIAQEWLEMAWDYYENRIYLKDGALDYVLQLKEKGIKIGLATSNFRDLSELVLKRHDILQYFDCVMTSNEVAFGKPSPDVFLKAAELMDVDPKDCLAFEDTHAGVLSARRAGMDVYAIADPLSQPYFEDIKKDVIAILEDFTSLVEKE